MNIGIYTIFDAYNYGSFLQAFSMQEFLRHQGHNVYMIDVRDSLRSRLAQKYVAKSISRTILKFKRFWAYRIDWKRLNIISSKNCPALDMAIIGSDEVWNIENPSFNHSKLFYGIDIPAKLIICYAPSLGYSTLDSYANCTHLLKAISRNLNWYGVRDAFTETFLTQIGVKEIHRICDPTILLMNEWGKYEKKYDIDEPYLVYYSYLDDTPYKTIIKRFAIENNLKTVSVGFDYKWCDKQIIISPLEFLSVIKNASYIVTSTFHGTVFSTLYNKKFIQIDPARKAVDFLQQINLDRHIKTTSYEDFSKLLKSDIDYLSANKLLENWKSSSIKDLCNFLNS